MCLPEEGRGDKSRAWGLCGDCETLIWERDKQNLGTYAFGTWGSQRNLQGTFWQFGMIIPSTLSLGIFSDSLCCSSKILEPSLGCLVFLFVSVC